MEVYLIIMFAWGTFVNGFTLPKGQSEHMCFNVLPVNVMILLEHGCCDPMWGKRVVGLRP